MLLAALPQRPGRSCGLLHVSWHQSVLPCGHACMQVTNRDLSVAVLRRFMGMWDAEIKSGKLKRQQKHPFPKKGAPMPAAGKKEVRVAQQHRCMRGGLAGGAGTGPGQPLHACSCCRATRPDRHNRMRIPPRGTLSSSSVCCFSSASCAMMMH